MLINEPNSFSPRELETMRYEAERADKEMAYGMDMKKMDIEVQKLETKFSSLLRIPIIIIKLPLLLLLGVAYITHSIKGTEPSENFWKLLK